MRVLHLLASPYLSGPADAVLQLAVAQRALGHQVTVAVDRKRRVAPSEELLAPRVDALDLQEPAPLELSVKSGPLALLRDRRTLQALAVDVVHAHFTHDHTLARLGRPKGAALVRSIHAPRSLRWSTPKADAWTVPTEGLARALLGQRVLVLPALVDAAFVPAARGPLRKALGLPEGPLIGMVSTFQRSRRHAVAVDAFALLRQRAPAASLVLIGDGELLAPTRARALAKGVAEAVRFPGYQAGQAFVRHLQALDEVWILGLGNDFSARAAAQARACGVRVVGVDEGALGRYADALVEPTAEAIAAAALQESRRQVTLEASASIAQRVLKLYEAVALGLRSGDGVRVRGEP